MKHIWSLQKDREGNVLLYLKDKVEPVKLRDPYFHDFRSKYYWACGKKFPTRTDMLIFKNTLNKLLGRPKHQAMW